MSVREIRVTLPANVTPAESQIIQDANRNRPGSRQPVRQLLARRSDLLAPFETTLGSAEDAIVRLGTGDNTLQEEVVRRKLEDMREQLRLPDDGALEQLLIRRIAISWMLSTYLDEALALRLRTGVDAAWINPWSKFASRAHRDLLHATRTLAAVRALGRRGPSVQVNVRQQVALSAVGCS